MARRTSLPDVLRELSVQAQDVLVDGISSAKCLSTARLACRAFRDLIDSGVRAMRLTLGPEQKQLLEEGHSPPILPRVCALMIVLQLDYDYKGVMKAALMTACVLNLSAHVRNQITELTIGFDDTADFNGLQLTLAVILRELPALRKVDLGTDWYPSCEPLPLRLFVNALASRTQLEVVRLPTFSRSGEVVITDFLDHLPPSLQRLETPDFVLLIRSGGVVAVEMTELCFDRDVQPNTILSILRQVMAVSRAPCCRNRVDGSSGASDSGSSSRSTGPVQLPTLVLTEVTVSGQVAQGTLHLVSELLAHCDEVVVRELTIDCNATEDAVLRCLRVLGRWPEHFSFEVYRTKLGRLPLPLACRSGPGPAALPPPVPQPPHQQHRDAAEEQRRRDVEEAAGAVFESVLRSLQVCGSLEAGGHGARASTCTITTGIGPHDKPFLLMRGSWVTELLGAGPGAVKAQLQDVWMRAMQAEIARRREAREKNPSQFCWMLRLSYLALPQAGCALVLCEPVFMVAPLCQTLAAEVRASEQAADTGITTAVTANKAAAPKPAAGPGSAQEVIAAAPVLEVALLAPQQLGYQADRRFGESLFGLLVHVTKQVIKECRSFGAVSVMTHQAIPTNAGGGVMTSDGQESAADCVGRLWKHLRILMAVTRKVGALLHTELTI